MSTSCKPALGPPGTTPMAPFPYHELPASEYSGMRQTSLHADGSNQNDRPAAIAAAREASRKEGEAAARAAFDQQMAQARDSVAAALNNFAHERAVYYQQIEGEVVQLALSIARKILRREAQIDPLLLAGMVRVALETIEDATKATIRVPPQQLSECRAYFAEHMDARNVPDVIEDANLPLNHCVLQTSLGTTEIGPEVQLKEIEQGLLDLLDRRPRTGV